MVLLSQRFVIQLAFSSLWVIYLHFASNKCTVPTILHKCKKYRAIEKIRFRIIIVVFLLFSHNCKSEKVTKRVEHNFHLKSSLNFVVFCSTLWTNVYSIFFHQTILIIKHDFLLSKTFGCFNNVLHFPFDNNAITKLSIMTYVCLNGRRTKNWFYFCKLKNG